MNESARSRRDRFGTGGAGEGSRSCAGSEAERVRFSSAILPGWARRTKSHYALLPVLYLRGISTGDFQEALAALVGKDAPNSSPAEKLPLRWNAFEAACADLDIEHRPNKPRHPWTTV